MDGTQKLSFPEGLTDVMLIRQAALSTVHSFGQFSMFSTFGVSDLY